MMTAVLREADFSAYPRLQSGAQLAQAAPLPYAVALCGRGARAQKLAFACQYADACQQKVLLLDACGVLLPRRTPRRAGALAQLPALVRKTGPVDVLRAAAFGPRADCYAAAGADVQALAALGYRRVFFACGRTVPPWADAAVLFPAPGQTQDAALLRQLYDANAVVLGIAGARPDQT